MPYGMLYGGKEIMEPDEQHEPMYDDLSDKLIDFEAENFTELAEKFIGLKSIRDKWADFVYEEYTNSIPEPPERDDL